MKQSLILNMKKKIALGYVTFANMGCRGRCFWQESKKPVESMLAGCGIQPICQPTTSLLDYFVVLPALLSPRRSSHLLLLLLAAANLKSHHPRATLKKFFAKKMSKLRTNRGKIEKSLRRNKNENLGRVQFIPKACKECELYRWASLIPKHDDNIIPLGRCVTREANHFFN